MQNKDRTEIVRQILDAANGSAAKDITKTRLMYMCFLTYRQLREYVALLTKNDLLGYDSLTKTYRTTEKGIRLLRFCNELDEMMMKKVSQPSTRLRQQRESAPQ